MQFVMIFSGPLWQLARFLHFQKAIKREFRLEGSGEMVKKF